MGECQDLEDYATKSIPDGCSFKALDSKGRIVGVTLNGIIKRPVSLLLTFLLGDMKLDKIKI